MEIVKAFVGAMAQKALADEGLTPMHVLSLLDSMVKLNLAACQGKEGKQSFSYIESVLSRRLSFWQSIDDITLISMLLKRIAKARCHLDAAEIFERAELQLLKLIGNFDPKEDIKINTSRIRGVARQVDSPLYDIKNLSEIAVSFVTVGTGSAIY